MAKRQEQFQDLAVRLWPELHVVENYDSLANKDSRLPRSVTFQVTDACNLACTYCYQHDKGTRRMSRETAYAMVDMLLAGEEMCGDYINPDISSFVILEFIGGEPFMEVELIDDILTYWQRRTTEMQHPWANRYMVSICSNGVLYRDERVQRFIQRHRNHLSLSITLDGHKELHDACRVFPDGAGSFDLAVDACHDLMRKGVNLGSKVTISPDNITYLYDALMFMVGEGYEEINANCVYEEGWTEEHAAELYRQMSRFSDFLLDNDLEDKIYCSLFEERFFHPKEPDDLELWCWGAGTPVLTESGYKPIEDIHVGEMVYTEDGTLHPVIDTMEHFADNVVQIKASGIFDMYCTDDHKLFAKPLDHIGFRYVKHYKPYGKYEVRELGPRDRVRMSQLPLGDVYFPEPLAYLAGRYLADGWDADNGNSRWICTSFEKADALEAAFADADVYFGRSDNKTVAQFYIKKAGGRGRELYELLEGCGRLAHGKHIPPQALSWTEESVWALLQGYLDADGYLNRDEQWRFSTVSEELAEGLMLLLRTLGYRPTCHVSRRAGKSVILGRQVVVRDRYEIYFYLDPERTHYLCEEDGYLWTSHFKTKPAEPMVVYNLTVEDNHSYIAGGLVSSNCGGDGLMLSCDPDGYLYPCIRFMESSLGDNVPPIRIGHVSRGIGKLPEEDACIHCMDCITRRTMSNDECFDCPIAEGCSWCAAYNYETTGDLDSRATFICPMHKARSLANVRHFNLLHMKHGDAERMELHCPRDWAVPIVGEEEYEMLQLISQGESNETADQR